MDDLDPTPDFDLTGLDLPADVVGESAHHPDDANWTVKPKADAPAGDEPATVDAALAAAFDQAEASGAAADDGNAWQREMRRLADEALRRAGIDPSERHTHGLSRREVWRRYDTTERMLRENLPGGLSFIASAYGAHLPPEQRAAAAGAVLQAFGIANPQALAEAERAELAEARQQKAQLQHAIAQAETRARTMLSDFASRHPDFDQHRRVMAGLMQSGAATSLEDAYKLARQAAGQPTADAERAQAEAGRRRQEVARARAAGTPQTRSAPSRAAEPRANSSKSIDELLNTAYDEMVGG